MPWNLVPGPACLVLIDWDGAGPGSRLWDLAYTAHGFVPLSATSSLDEHEQCARLHALVEGYRLKAALHQDLVELLGLRLLSIYELLRHGHEHGVEPWSRLWSEGHGTYWCANARYVYERHQLFLGALGG